MMKVVKRTAMVIFYVGKAYFLLVSFCLLILLGFIIFPYIVENYANLDNPVADFIPFAFLIVWLIWVFVFGFKGYKNLVTDWEDKDLIAFLIVLSSFLVMMTSYFLWTKFGLDWWIGGVGILSIFGLLGLAYLILRVIKGKKIKNITVSIQIQTKPK